MDRAAETTFLAAESRLLGLAISVSLVVIVSGAFRFRCVIQAKLDTIFILTVGKALTYLIRQS
jgi:hypothetical protein